MASQLFTSGHLRCTASCQLVITLTLGHESTTKTNFETLRTESMVLFIEKKTSTPLTSASKDSSYNWNTWSSILQFRFIYKVAVSRHWNSAFSILVGTCSTSQRILVALPNELKIAPGSSRPAFILASHLGTVSTTIFNDDHNNIHLITRSDKVKGHK